MFILSLYVPQMQSDFWATLSWFVSELKYQPGASFIEWGYRILPEGGSTNFYVTRRHYLSLPDALTRASPLLRASRVPWVFFSGAAPDDWELQ